MDLIKNGIPVPEKIIISQATVDDTGKVYAGIGWTLSADVQFGVWGKFRPKSKSVANGLADLINGVREQVGAKDDTPGVLTVAELGEVLFGVALGKH